MSSIQQPITGETCIPNISTQERRKRLTFGAATFVIALIILGVLMATGVSPWWRIILLPLFMGATTGYFQWNDKTCIALARRGTYNLNDEEKKMEDPAVLAKVREQARRVQLKALLAAIPLTLIALVLPILR